MNKHENKAHTMVDVTQPVKPIALASGPDKKLWIVQVNNAMTKSKINVLSRSGRPKGEVALPEGAMPLDIIRLGNDLLVVDPGMLRVYTINSETRAINNFGDAEFLSQIKDVNNRKSSLESIINWSPRGALFFAIAALITLIMAKIQRMTPAEYTETRLKEEDNKQTLYIPNRDQTVNERESGGEDT